MVLIDPNNLIYSNLLSFIAHLFILKSHHPMDIPIKVLKDSEGQGTCGPSVSWKELLTIIIKVQFVIIASMLKGQTDEIKRASKIET